MKRPFTISTTQKENPIVRENRLIGAEIQWSDTVTADYTIGKDLAVLFLSLKWHRQHPEYIGNRIKAFKGGYTTRVLLLIVNVPDPDANIARLTVVANANAMNLVLAFDYEEAARWLMAFYKSQDSSVDALKASNETNPEIAVDVLNALGASKREAELVISNYPTLADALLASPGSLASCTGMSESKAESLAEAVAAPF